MTMILKARSVIQNISLQMWIIFFSSAEIILKYILNASWNISFLTTGESRNLKVRGSFQG